MAFSDVLKDVVDRTEGALGALVVGLDGIPVEEYSLGGDVDTQSLIVEYSLLLREIEKGSQAAQLGAAREVTVVSDKAMIALRKLSDDYFCVLVVKPEGNFGKGKFLLRMSMPRLLNEL